MKKLFKVIRTMYVRVVVHFYYTGKPKWLNPISKRRKSWEALSKKRLQEIDGGELFDLLETLRLQSKSTGSQYSDYYNIWSDLNKLKPKNILECGSGISTLVFAYYIHKQKNENGFHFVTLEENEVYYNNIVSIFPKKFHKYVEFTLTERVERDYGGLQGCYYKDFPMYRYEYVYIDGPVDRKDGDKNNKKCFNADLINLVKNNDLTINALLDQRISTLWALKKLIPDGDIEYSVTRSVTVFKNITQADIADYE